MGKKVLITGGSGMIGSHITEKLLAQGFAVNYLSRKPEKMDRIKAYGWDPDAGQFDEQALQDVEYIINLAGSGIADKRWSAGRKIDIMESRTKSTAFLRDQLKTGKHTVKTFISASAIGYYGPDHDDEWLIESSPQGTDFLATAVKAWEDESRAFDELGIRTVIFRMGVVLSNKGGAFKKLIQPIQLGAGAQFGNGQQWMSWIHIDDVAGAFGFALNDERVKGIYNLAAPNPVRNKEFVETAAKILDKPIILPRVPSFALRLAFGEMASTVLGSARVSATKITETGYHFKYEALDQALQELIARSR